MNILKAIWTNRWVRFGVTALIYTLLFVVWTGNLWLLLGLPLIYDYFISHLMYRYVGQYSEALCARSRLYRTCYEWFNALVFATVVATIVHIFLFQMYFIPSPSMERSLLVGDYLYVSKVTYGPQMPNTPLSLPFVHHTMPFSQTRKSFSDAIQWPYHRLKGLRRIARNDVVVFNFPEGDTVVLEYPDVSYYDLVRMMSREQLQRQYTLVTRPVDKRENYIKRCVAIPGDSLEIRAGKLYVNGAPQEPIPGLQTTWLLQTTKPFNAYTFEKYGIEDFAGDRGRYQITATESIAEALRRSEEVVQVQRARHTLTTDVFPRWPEPRWSQDDYGPIWVPQRGATVALTTENLPLYARIISLYEGHTLEVEGDEIRIDGAPATSYTFAMDYYWMMGDNRHNSADSRFWGFVPEDHIVGKASFVWLSMDERKSFPANIRWSRMFRKVR